MRNTIASLAVLAALLPSLAGAQAGPGRYSAPGPARDAWYIGFGVGSGAGGLTIDGQSRSFKDFLSPLDTWHGMLQFEVGATVRQDLLLGFDLRVMRAQGSGSVLGRDLDESVTVGDYLAMVTWFPMERGLFLRGGAGLASISADSRVNGGSTFTTETVRGVAALAGIGYAFWLGQHFNLTLNADLSGQLYSHDAGQPSSSRFFDVYLGFGWY